MNSTDKETLKKYTETLIQMTGQFCDSYLDQECKELCEKLIRKMARKRVVPFLSGKIETWAAATIYTIGSINFLYDKSSEPHLNNDELCEYFGVAKSTVGQKSKAIRDMFKLRHWDSDFSTKSMQDKNPFSNVFLNGIPIPLGMLPPELQEVARANPRSALTILSLPETEDEE